MRRAARLPWLLAALPLLGLARLLPAGSVGLWLRLGAATLVVLLPGRLLARAVGRRSGSATLVWALAAIAAALAVTFALHGSLTMTILLLVAVSLVASPLALRRAEEPSPRARILVVLGGIALGIALWHVAGIVHGDAFFHLGRVRKLDELGSLSLRAVDEFRDGGLHPGYAFPLWHGFLALVARLGGVDPTDVVLHEPSVIAPLACLVAFESALSVFRSAWLGAAVVLASVSLFAFAPGTGGSYATLALPGSVARQLLVPAAIAGFFAFVRSPSWSLGATTAAAGLALTLVHPTHAVFLAIPLLGFVIARVALVRCDLRAGVGGLAALAAPVGLVLAWLSPIVADTASHNPGPEEKLRALKQYASQLVVPSPNSYHLKAEVFSRTGALAVAALVLVPFAAAAARRRWAAFVLGGSLLVLAIELSPWLFPRLADVVSLSQARRAAGFVPFAFAFAGGAAVLARGLRWALLPAALAAGIVLQWRFPGDFGRGLQAGGPTLPTWIALWGGLAGFLAALLLALRFRAYERTDWLPAVAALLFVVPVAVAGFRDWTPSVVDDPYGLTPGLVEALRTKVPKRAVVYADLETSYRISALAPVYVANGPPAHVADTKANRPYRRRSELIEFLRTGTLAIPRRYGAGWLVLRRNELKGAALRLPRGYADDRFVLLRL